MPAYLRVILSLPRERKLAGAGHDSAADARVKRGRPRFSYIRIVPDDAAGQRVFSGISRFYHPFITALLHSHLPSPSSALKTSVLRASQISSLTNSMIQQWRRPRFLSASFPTERDGSVVSHWTSIREDPDSIPGPAILISVFHGFPKSLQTNDGMGLNKGHGRFLLRSLVPVQLAPSLITSLSTRCKPNYLPSSFPF
ncbi:hypothetical protein PR048_017824 [Dryococelus australis]|uniref:Uncharacterized protein n=1 Tax=Dryococelus australis TaxID=614101 RepID=A0ABQ9HAN5_9NEOP|nr:hypothetical protein PR048_017824 [Dryococelus australis]